MVRFMGSSTYQTHPVTTLALSPDGGRLAFAGWDETVQVCDLTGAGKNLTYKRHTDHVLAVAWSPDGQYLVSAGGSEHNGDVQVWSRDERPGDDSGGRFSYRML